MIKLGDVPDALFDEFTATVKPYQVGLFGVRHTDAEPRITYVGSGVLVTRSRLPYLLTAGHVWQELAHFEEIGLCIKETPHDTRIKRDEVEARVVYEQDDPDWGPDLWTGGHRLHVRFDRRRRPDNATVARLTFRLRGCIDNGPHITANSITGGRHPLVQVTDLLLGCITSSLNQRTTRPGKLFLVQRLREKVGCDPTMSTGPALRKFNVWYFSPSSGDAA